MIQVSNEFKKAIKEPERRIKGYVEVLYDVSSVEVTSMLNMTSTYTSVDEISNGVRVENLYGSVDYLPLDGTRLVMGETNTNSGFISDDLYEELPTPTVSLIFGSRKVKGITLYFRTNIPTELTITYSDGTSSTISNNTKEDIQIIFEEEKTLTHFTVFINNVMYQDRKIYLMEVDLGVTQVYKDQDLVEFTVDEEVNKLVEEVPINETNIILNNMSDLFNPLNPTGIVPYLSENTLIKPYIGVLTENLGVEYVKMGEFYFDSYTNNSDATTTLVGKNIIKQTQFMEITNGLINLAPDNFIIDSSMPEWQDPRNTRKAIIESSGILCDVNVSPLVAHTVQFMKSYYLLDYLKDATATTFGIVYANRNNKIILRNPVVVVSDTLTKNELINDAEYKKIDKINTIMRRSVWISSTETTSNFKVINESFILDTSPKIVIAEHENIGGGILTQTGASSAERLFSSYFFSIIRVTGTIGANISLSSTTTYNDVEKEREKKFTNKAGNEKEIILDTKTYLHNLTGSFSELNGQLDYSPSYEMSFDYNGDPSLEAGDYINVETPYGYKPLFIQKNRFKFDGGLSGSIEGVE